VLDVGCGAGRFAEIALGAGANVIALDYSRAVDACHANLRAHPGLHVVQGDIYALPLRGASFPFVYSLGVLQHTPDVAKAFTALPPMLSPGGRLCVDFYQRSWRNVFTPKYWLRPVTKRMQRDRLLTRLEQLVPRLLPVSAAVGRLPLVGGALRRLVPVADYRGVLPLSDAQQVEWSVLDTFDWLAPEYDHPQTPVTLARWLAEAGLRDVEVLRAGHLVGRGTAPDAHRD
jgi:SAM-dependent methyltransferase